MHPPHTRREAVVDTLHPNTPYETVVADPYRWLEDGDDPDVQAWVAEQNRRTREALDARPDRGVWHERLVALMVLPVVLGAQVRGDVLVTLERPAGAQQGILVARSAVDAGATPVVLADPAAGTDDAAAAVDWFWTSPDGSLVAYGVSEGGTENSVLRVVRTADGSHLADEIPDTRACSVGWEPDGSGFCYTRYPHGDDYHRTVHTHRLGDDWHDDPVVWADHPTPQTWPDVQVSPDGRYVLVSAMVGWSRYDQHLLDLDSGQWHPLVVGVDAISDLSFGTDGFLYGTTTLDAPRGRMVRVPLAGAGGPPEDPTGWVTIVPERDVVLGGARVAGGSLLVVATRRAVDTVERWSPDGELLTSYDQLGVVSVSGLTADPLNGRAFVLTAAFDAPATLWHLGHDVHERWHPPAPPPDAVPALDVDEVDYTSPDGTVIGMFLIHRADVTPDARTPAILTGYGGFAISETPVWSPTIAAWCAGGGLYAVAGLRGGFEHGEDWHRAGNRANKQRVFDDFAAAADWLVATGRTSRDRLAIAGGSNGGLLVGATLTQRPDVCRAVWCAVPLLDMVRFPDFLIARLWTDEYGDPAVPEELAWLHAYSPYHNVRDGECYPAVLLTTAEGDTRVDPMHARKMAARLQEASACQQERPVLLHQEGRAGHGVGKPVGKRAAEQADVLAWFSWQLDVRA
jgi:prolyl oligopeptidase